MTGSALDWADIGKGAAGGLGRGTAGLLGAPGSVGGLVRGGADWVAGQLPAGMSDVARNAVQRAATLARYTPQLRPFTQDDAAQVQEKIEGLTGKFYEPKTIPGQYASTIMEFAPGAALGGEALAPRLVNWIAPALASETAGQLTKGGAAEPYARAIAGVGSGLATGKLITPTTAPSPAYAAKVATLERAGVPVSAAERTGSQALRWLETSAGDLPFSSGAVQAQQGRQAEAFNRAVTREIFDPAQLRARGITPASTRQEVWAAGQRSLSDEYNRLSSGYRLHADPQLMQDLSQAQLGYARTALPTNQRAGLRNVRGIFQDVVDELHAGGGSIPGDVYQAQRSRIGKLAEAQRGPGGDPQLADAFDRIQAALDNAMQRRLPRREAEAWALNNRRYALMKQLDPAAAKDTEFMSPQAVAQAVKSGRQGLYARGAGRLDQLANAAASVIKPMPQSGTAPRMWWHTLGSAPSVSTGGIGALATLMFGPLGGAAATALPHVVGRTAVSRLGQRYLANQVLPQDYRDILAQTLAQQAISQPAGIARSSQENEAMRQRARAEREALGLE